MIGGRHILSMVAMGMALALPARAADAPWVVTGGSPTSAAIKRTIENVTVDYRLIPGEYDRLSITVASRCGDGPWTMSYELAPESFSDVRETMGQMFNNAVMNCTLSEGLEARFIDGLDAAYDKMRPTLPPHVGTVGTWSLEDKGSHPGDDSQRTVQMSKALANVSMIYRPGNYDGASITIEFKPCNGMSLNSGFDFGNPPEDHLKVVSEQVTEAYADFAKDCKSSPEPQSLLMQDFPKALATIEQWLKDKPFVYPAAPTENEQGQ